MSYLVKGVLLLGVLLVSAALGIGAHGKAGGDLVGLLVGVYASGFAFLSGCFVLFPGGTKVKDEWGDGVRVGRVDNLSNTQAVLLLAWCLGFGAFTAYFVGVHGG